VNQLFSRLALGHCLRRIGNVQLPAICIASLERRYRDRNANAGAEI
jgi:hypothetical protein